MNMIVEFTYVRNLMIVWLQISFHVWRSESFSELSQISKMEILAKIFHDL